jgi:hypothetical protein
MIPALIVRMMRGKPFNQLVGCCCKNQCFVEIRNKFEWRNSRTVASRITSWEDTIWHQFGTIAILRF